MHHGYNRWYSFLISFHYIDMAECENFIQSLWRGNDEWHANPRAQSIYKKLKAMAEINGGLF